MSNYDGERAEGAKTLGDAYRHHQSAPEAFVAGVQYALDSILREAERVRSAISPGGDTSPAPQWRAHRGGSDGVTS